MSSATAPPLTPGQCFAPVQHTFASSRCSRWRTPSTWWVATRTSWRRAGGSGGPAKRRMCWRCSPTTSPRGSGSSWRRTRPSRAWTWRAHCTTTASTSWAGMSACPPAWSTASFSNTTSSQMPGRPSDASRLWDKTCCCVRFTSPMCYDWEGRWERLQWTLTDSGARAAWI